ncbi:MAG TPA: sigma factor-like helix-turn-helix DNA-binding protein [Candidatus Saccharimonadales bacterium]|nr:sigma factor-like helix-turn-helix DNA-binding protein [Candidatus Saccharimonadales bacterium]
MEDSPKFPNPAEAADQTAGEIPINLHNVPRGKRLETVLDGESAEMLLAKLPERERKILEMKYGLGDYDQNTYEEVGREFDLTRERIRQLHNSAIQILAKLVKEKRG